MAELKASAGSSASGALSVSGQPDPSAQSSPSPEDVADQLSAVINVHDCNLQQIEAAVRANAHTTDPHPAAPGALVRRHPVYLVAFDPTQPDEQGRPAAGAPLDVDMETTRRIFSGRYLYVSPDPPPDDGSHISVAGMHSIAELDSKGQPTGRVTLGSAEEGQS